MKRTIYPISAALLVPFLILIVSCNKSEDNPVSGNGQNSSGEGLCIYPTEVIYTPDLSYQNFDLALAPITGKPIISYGDIISYDTTSHILKLTYSRDSLASKIGQIHVHGEPFLVTLDSSKIYGGWFWTPVSSIPCHWVVIEPDCVFDSLGTHEIRIKLGYPTEAHFTGEDPRNNRKIFDRLIKDGKAK